MLIELFMLLQVLALIVFGVAFFTKQEVIWGIALITFGLLIMTALTIQVQVPVYNATTSSYSISFISRQEYPVMAFNIGMFALSLLYFFFDIFDKWGITLGSKMKDK
jgi:cobalamin synthase